MSRPYEKLLLTLGGLRVVFGLTVMIILSRQNVMTSYVALGLLTAGQITDHLDGYIARKLSSPTLAGYIQDSIADKLFQFSILVAISREYSFPLIVIWGVFCREVLILSTRILKKPSKGSLRSLKVYSVLYAIFLRGALVLILTSPIICNFTSIPLSLLIDIGTGISCISLLPAGLGLSISLREAVN